MIEAYLSNSGERQLLSRNHHLAQSPNTQLAGASDSASPTVFVIDDEPDILGFVEMALADEGYRVISSTTAVGALEKIREASPDLLLLDSRLPGVDGLSFLHCLREDETRTGRQRIPVLLMTAARITAEEARSIGAQGVLAKPFELDELAEQTKAYARCNQNEPD